MTFMTEAMRLDPHPPAVFMYYVGLAQFNLEKFEAAATTLKNATALNPNDPYPFLWLAAGDYTECPLGDGCDTVRRRLAIPVGRAKAGTPRPTTEIGQVMSR